MAVEQDHHDVGVRRRRCASDRRCWDGVDAGQAGAEGCRPKPKQDDQHHEDRRGHLADSRPRDPHPQGTLLDQHGLDQDERDPSREDERLRGRRGGHEPHQGEGGDGGSAVRPPAPADPRPRRRARPRDHDDGDPAGLEGMDRVAGERLQEHRDADQQRVPGRRFRRVGAVVVRVRLGRDSASGRDPARWRSGHRGVRDPSGALPSSMWFDSLARARAAPARPSWPGPRTLYRSGPRDHRPRPSGRKDGAHRQRRRRPLREPARPAT